MSDHKTTYENISDDDSRVLTFRGVQGESDYPLLLAINHSSRSADGDFSPVSLEDLAHAFTHAIVGPK